MPLIPALSTGAIPTSLAAHDLSPFASFVVMRSSTRSADPGLLLHELLTSMEPASGWIDTLEVPLRGSGRLVLAFAAVLVEDRQVTWLNEPLNDRLNHLLIAFIDGEFGLVYVSDARLKMHVHDALSKGELTEWHCVEQAVLNTAFLVGQHLRALWLGATHRSTDIRPDSKVLSGLNLREAVEPFADASFMASAARSPLAGVSLKRSGVWKGAKTDWQGFCDHAEAVIDGMRNAVTSGHLTSAVHPVLSTWCADFTNVAQAYDVCWADPETLEPGSFAAERVLSLRDFEMRVTAQPVGATPQSVRIEARHVPSAQTTIADIDPYFDREKIRFSVALDANAPAEFNAFKSAIQANAELLRIYYDSGHAIIAATLSAAEIQDHSFDDFVDGDFLDAPALTPYSVDQEKPAGSNLAAWIPAMRTTTDRSLFQWVVKHGIGQLGLPPLARGLAWLYCDDGSGEIADFIHVSKPAVGLPKITAIHVKGANSASGAREVSVSAYEVVVGQAVKNVRRILAGSIRQKIEEAIALQGPVRTWDAPWPAHPTLRAQRDVLRALAAIGAQCEFEVVVVQPHVMRSHYRTVLGSMKAKQLRTLLFGARTMARSASARFRVVIDGR